ncbi:MAG: VWA domain-containing protein [Paludibacteraceae bacterium]|nr:VWA domain-containing protein [Paludibacteraceae bacterium]
MEKINVYNLIVLDESGSMDSIRNSAISGCNETIQSIRATQNKYREEQNHFLSLVSFNSDESNKMIFDKVPIEEVREVAAMDYRPNACTPLYDAIGISASYLHDTMPKDVECIAMVTVITDGYENASEKYDGRRLKSLVAELESLGWKFSYIGANQDVIQESQKIGISRSFSFMASEKGVKRAFNSASVYLEECAEECACERRMKR